MDPCLPPDMETELDSIFLLLTKQGCAKYKVETKLTKKKIAMSQAGDKTVTESKNSCLSQRN